MRSQAASFEGGRVIIVLCTMFLVSSTINASLFYIAWLDTFWIDIVYRVIYDLAFAQHFSFIFFKVLLLAYAPTTSNTFWFPDTVYEMSPGLCICYPLCLKKYSYFSRCNSGCISPFCEGSLWPQHDVDYSFFSSMLPCVYI